jgi:hypothetical protein
MEQENDTAMRRKEMASRDHRPDVFLGGKPHRSTNVAQDCCHNNGRLTYLFVAIDHIVFLL